mmetsp:Transcript_7188/g.10708  ORF Transcript_7188/g.10708 Transcript_7188/m.10708 type:complete len:537 (-) Transcript_7188:308-1918(-)|eukprot:CAMPEP_0197318500 /NCGR_PEP_ID=MMETSP0891-20130614/51347_1 /TAXON_ID=44058 ORGANISM="Aureoumbra lagunensis, Strain CCMP1510" /NCGR_SAMPLE_ID=MMETSP0891 /ASSEMBLY_ACC=CAM_ASM_000534 /LENGTH=536 /DNA_ID=CAMNT_0042808999 /DNA_START=14 /DNA_END=1624 /DNA_ORIENTATION=-
MTLGVTSANARQAEAFSKAKLTNYNEIEKFAEAREEQAELEIGDADARLASAQNKYEIGVRELKAFVSYVHRTTRLDSALLGVHNETRALLMESGFGASVVFGTRRSGWSPLGELLLATHQLDWRLGERCVGLHRLCSDLVTAAEETADKHAKIGGGALKSAKNVREKLRKATNDVKNKHAAFRASRPSPSAKRVDLWFAENDLRIACRACSQQQSLYLLQARDTINTLDTLHIWREAALSHLVQLFVKSISIYRDDLRRVGERLISVADSSACLNRSENDAIGTRINEARAQLPEYSETRDDFLARQAALDATAKSKGALLFPQMPSEETTNASRHILVYPPPSNEGHHQGSEESPAAIRSLADAACGTIPTMPSTNLVARKGVLEFERNVALGAASLGWTHVFLILSFDGFLSAFPGRTEGSSQTDSPIFRIDLANSTVLDDDEEGPLITIVTRAKSSITAYVVGDRHIHLRAKDAADKFGWLRSLADPLIDFSLEQNESPSLEQASETASTPPSPNITTPPSSDSPAVPTTFV